MVWITSVFLMLEPFILLTDSAYLAVSPTIAIEQVFCIIRLANALAIISTTLILIVNVGLRAETRAEGHYIFF